MEVTKKGIQRVVNKLVQSNKTEVINALKLSDIEIDDNIGNNELFDITMFQLEQGNNKLIFNLGYVLDEAFDLRAFQQQDFSNAGGLALPPGGSWAGVSPTSSSPSWWSQNSGNVLTAGVGLLGGLFGKKDNPAPVVTAPSGDSNSMLLMMQQQQQNAANQQRQEAARRDDESKRRSSNMMIGGIVGGVVLISVVLVVVLKK